MKHPKKLFFLLFISLTHYSFSFEKSGFILMIMLYDEQDPVRLEEYITCLEKNLNHPLIDHIYVWYDRGSKSLKNKKLKSIKKDTNQTTRKKDFILTFLAPYADRVSISYKRQRATFGDMFQIASEQFPGKRIILSNADIYFNDTLFALESYDLTNKILGLTRWNVLEDNSLWLQDFPIPNPFSQDTWIFKAPLFVPNADTIFLGTAACDCGFNFIAKQTKLITIINPCLTIQCCHLHKSNIRHYLTTNTPRYTGTIEGVDWTYLS